MPSEAVAGAFNILTKTSSYARAVDGQPEDSKDYEDGTLIKQTTLDTDDKSQCWFFYPVVEDVGQTIETAATYTANKNFVSTVSDQRGNNTTYSYNQNTGTLTSVSDAKSTTSYTYNTDNSLASVTNDVYTTEYTYTNDRLTTINADNEVYYQFAYDSYGRATNVQVGYDIEPYRDYLTLASYSYNTAGLLSTVTYGNNWKVNYVYDSLDRVTQVNYNNSSTQKLEYLYGSDGNVAQIIDYAAGTRTKPVYDLAGRLVAVKQYDGTAQTDTDILTEFTYTYADKTNYLTEKTMDLPTREMTATYTYGDAAVGEMPDQVYSVSYGDNTETVYAYDDLGRLTTQTVNLDNASFANTYTYLDVNADRTTTLVSTYTTKTGTYSYTYDNVGNITEIVFTPIDPTQSTKTVSYHYDSLNRLIRENNEFAGKTWFYYYFGIGNICDVQESPYTPKGSFPSTRTEIRSHSYSDYTWIDRLTEFNGKTITYDTIGNPTSIGTANLTWQGRTLAQYADGTDSYSYEYDMSGHRISKTVNGVETKYYYDGDQLVAQKSGNDRITFMFDANGSAFGFYYNNAPYFFIKNIQGDVTAITNFAGTVIGTYTYDAWGNLIPEASDLSDEVAAMNPIRYRGYYYDAETGYYFLNSRYYDAEMGRFISSDAISTITATQAELTDKNLFAYCDNNPVMRVDPSGMFWDVVFDAFSTLFSLFEVILNPTDVTAWVGLAVDAVSLVVPFIPAIGILRIAGKIDNIIPVLKNANIVDSIDNVADVTKSLDNLGHANIVSGGEIKLPNQISFANVTESWDNFLGPNQTNVNIFTGEIDTNRIFSADGTRSIRFGAHEMNSLDTTKAHFHYEDWVYDPLGNSVTVYNRLQRIK